MSDNELQARLSIVPGDDSGASLLEDFSRRIESARQRVDRLSDGFEEIERQKFDNLYKAFQTQRVNAMNREVQHLRDGLLDTEKAASGVADQMERAGRAGSRSGGSSGGNERDLFKDDFGDASTGFGALGSAINSIAGSGAGEAAAVLGDVLGFLEYLPALAMSLSGIGLVAGPALIAGIGALGLAFKQAADQAEIANAAAERFFANRNAINELLNSGMTKEDAEKRLAELRREEDAKTRLIEDGAKIREMTFAEAQRQATEVDGILGDLSARLTTATFTIGGGFSKFEEGVEGAKGELVDIQAEINALEAGLERGIFAANQTTLAIEELTQKQEQYEDSLKSAGDQVDLYSQQIEDLNTSFEKAKTRATASDVAKTIEDIAESIIAANEKTEDAEIAEEERKDAHLARMAQIENSGNEKIEDLKDQSKQREIDTQEKITELEADFDKQESKAREEFRRDQLDKEREFRQRQADIDREFKQKQSDARLNFDVQSFLAAQREKDDAERELQRDRNANNRESNRFEVEREEARITLDERIQGLRDELAEFQVNQQLKIDTEKLAIQERLDAETLAYDEAERKITEREERLEARAEARAERQEAREDRRAEALEIQREADHQDQVNRLIELRDTAQENYDAQLKAVDQTKLSIDKLSEAADTFNSIVENSTGLSWLLNRGGNDVTPSNNPGVNQLPDTPLDTGFPSLPPPPPPGDSRLMNPLSLARRSPLANPAAFANRGAGGNRGGVTVQVTVSGNNFGRVATPDDIQQLASEVAARIDLSQVETIDAVGAAIGNKSRVT
jgi:hypothetical protein